MRQLTQPRASVDYIRESSPNKQIKPCGRIVLEGHGAGERREAGPVPGAQVNAGAAQQHVDDTLLPVLDGMVERALPLGVLAIDICSVLNERRNNFFLSPLGGQVQRPLTVKCLVTALHKH